MKKKIEYESILLSMGENCKKNNLHITNSLLNSSLQMTNQAHVQQLSASLMSNNSDYDRQVMKALGIKSTNKVSKKKNADVDNDQTDIDKKIIINSNDSDININTNNITSSSSGNTNMTEAASTKNNDLHKSVPTASMRNDNNNNENNNNNNENNNKSSNNNNANESKPKVEVAVGHYDYDDTSDSEVDEREGIAGLPTAVPSTHNFVAAGSAKDNTSTKKRRRSRNQVCSDFSENWNIMPAVNNRRAKNKYLVIPGYDEHRFIKPKGISRTSTKTAGFRVQLTKYQSKSDKFSRNAHRFIDAVWLYECAVLMNDRPPELNSLLLSGNYSSIVTFGVINDELEYYQELGKWINQFSKTNLLKPDEANIAVLVYDSMVFRYKDVVSGQEVVSRSLREKNESCISKFVSDSPLRSSEFIEIVELHPEYLQ